MSLISLSFGGPTVHGWAPLRRPTLRAPVQENRHPLLYTSREVVLLSPQESCSRNPGNAESYSIYYAGSFPDAMYGSPIQSVTGYNKCNRG